MYLLKTSFENVKTLHFFNRGGKNRADWATMHEMCTLYIMVIDVKAERTCVFDNNKIVDKESTLIIQNFNEKCYVCEKLLLSKYFFSL